VLTGDEFALAKVPALMGDPGSPSSHDTPYNNICEIPTPDGTMEGNDIANFERHWDDEGGMARPKNGLHSSQLWFADRAAFTSQS